MKWWQSRRLVTFLLAQIVAVATLVAGNFIHEPFYTQLAALLIGTAEGSATILIAAFTVNDYQDAKHEQELKVQQLRQDLEATLAGLRK